MKFEFDVPESDIYDEFMKIKDDKITQLKSSLKHANERIDALILELQKYDSCAGCWHRTLDGDAKSCFDSCQKEKRHRP